jgi:alpha-tubulin suppressor-like RCC1 family protein
MAIRSDGALFTWGENGSGQLGQNDLVHISSPVQVGTNSWSVIGAGLPRGYSGDVNYAVAIRSNGTLWAWGANLLGALGDGTSTYRSSPVQIGASSWTQVTAGSGGTTAAIRSDGGLFIWGDGQSGQHGNSTVTQSRNSPVQLGTSSWSLVVNNYRSMFAIRSDGLLFGWGENSRGELGNNTVISRSSPVQIGSMSWSFVPSSQRGNNLQTIYAISSNNTLWSWGTEFGGARGDAADQVSDRSSPSLIGNNREFTTRGSFIQLGSSWSNVYTSLGGGQIIGKKADGTLWTWGSNVAGRLGLNDTVDRSSPTQIGSDSWSSVAIGSAGYAIAVKDNGTLWAWGYNFDGELGDGTRIHRSSPIQIGSSSWLGVASGGFTSFAVRNDNTLWFWGSGFSGVSGVSTNLTRSSPVQIGTENIAGWSATGWKKGTPIMSSSAAAIGVDGALWTWGSGAIGQLGRNNVISTSSPGVVGGRFIFGLSSPTQVGAGTSWRYISAGFLKTTLIDGATNYAYNQGANYIGQFGDNTIISRSTPTLLSGSNNTIPTYVDPGIAVAWSKVDVNNSTTAAIDATSRLFMWGSETNGIIGDNSVVYRFSPVQIGSNEWQEVSIGTDHVLAIKHDGTLWAWGGNSLGQLGKSDVTHRSSPVQVGSQNNWRSVTAGSYFSAAVDSENKLYTWGNNQYGQVGDGSTVHRSAALQIGTYGGWSRAFASNRNDVNAVYAISIDGTVWSWGENTNGSLGDGTTNHRSSPVQIQSGSSRFIDITTANNNGYLLYALTDGGITS